ncbi:hypothetical protein RRG08_059368 [Elysia crispata]|uniref:Uncharacterized protein n=1 Tax=Elysia crispata TaxID=231223 RepID=A0AAE1BDN4_9GAST|nr:hypothetical protein RRG08_059368 [Elysia crispata]
MSQRPLSHKLVYNISPRPPHSPVVIPLVWELPSQNEVHVTLGLPPTGRLEVTDPFKSAFNCDRKRSKAKSDV